MPVQTRLRFAEKLQQVILERSEKIIDQIQKETGKCRSDALISEIFPALDHLDYLGKFAVKALADRKVHTPLPLLGKKSKIIFEPMGTALIISPWNYPFYQAVVPCLTSFVAGCATVYKPSEHTPLEGLFEELLKAAGFDTNWIQVAYGDGAFAQSLINERPDKIFFTGSLKTGKRIMSQASELMIPVELELGGKDPMIVFEDANIDRAASGALWGGMTNAGQSCTSVERLLIHRSIFEKFKKTLISKACDLTIAQDTDGNADYGLMTTDFQTKTVWEHVSAAVKQGARLLTGNDWKGEGRKVPPLILDQVTPQMRIWTEETFGPTMPLMAFDTEEEAIRLANDSEYGLSASVWTHDLKRADRISRALKTGNVSINNVMLTEGNHALPFGGIKASGFGRYKGEFGLYCFSNIKSILVDADSAKIEANWYPYTAEKYRLFNKLTQALFGAKGFLSLLGFAVNGLRLESYSNKAAKLSRSNLLPNRQSNRQSEKPLRTYPQ